MPSKDPTRVSITEAAGWVRDFHAADGLVQMQSAADAAYTVLCLSSELDASRKDAERLSALLACEHGERAPAPWSCTVHNGDVRWVRLVAPADPRSDLLCVMRQPYQSHYIWRRGLPGAWHKDGGEPFRYMLEAIEAADKENP